MIQFSFLFGLKTRYGSIPYSAVGIGAHILNCIFVGYHFRKVGRAVYCTGLENQRVLTGPVSSNLTPSALFFRGSTVGSCNRLLTDRSQVRTLPPELCVGGEIGRHTGLRSQRRNGIEGSSPSLRTSKKYSKE